MKTLTMYLPQFHRVIENDNWWGEGFTEWTAVRSAFPLFDGHNQPRVPLHKNYYDLLQKDTMLWQADLMKSYGIDGQCIYHYYFKDGRRILEKPAENLLNWKDVSMPFCFCWANGSWTRTWSKLGGNSWADKFEKTDNKDNGNGILLEQKYGREREWKEHFEYLLPFFEDERYIKLDGKPVFAIFDTGLIPCIYQMIDYWKELSRLAGFPGLYFIGMNSLNMQKGFDAVLMNAPHMFWNLETVRRKNNVMRPDYQETWDNILKMPPIRGMKTYFGGVSDCDDSPRRGNNGVSFSGFSLDAFRNGMIGLYRKSSYLNNEFVFINAWNEWGEGMYLEPDEKNGYGYLEAIKTAKEVALDNRTQISFSFESDSEQQDESGLKKEVEKQKMISRCFNKWMSLREDGKNICDYLLKYGIKTVAVYGIGRMGKHLFFELEGSGIEVRYIIDRRTEMHHPKYPIKGPEEKLEEVDAVIITPVWDFEHIYEKLKYKMKSKFFSLYELVDES